MPPEVNNLLNLLRWNPTVILSKGTFLFLGGWKIPPKVDHAIGTTRVPRDFNVCHGWKHIQHHRASLPWDHALLSFWFCACRIYMRWAKKLPFTCSTLQKHSGAMFPQGVNVCLPTRIFTLVLSKLFGWHAPKSIRSSPAFFSWTSCPVITKQNVFYPPAWSLVTCFPFQDFTRHSRVRCCKNQSIFSSVAPQKNPCCCLQLGTPICSSTKGHGAWRWNLWPDNIAWHVMSHCFAQKETQADFIYKATLGAQRVWHVRICHSLLDTKLHESSRYNGRTSQSRKRSP